MTDYFDSSGVKYEESTNHIVGYSVPFLIPFFFSPLSW